MKAIPRSVRHLREENTYTSLENLRTELLTNSHGWQIFAVNKRSTNFKRNFMIIAMASYRHHKAYLKYFVITCWRVVILNAQKQLLH